MRTDTFDYTLPAERIAQKPLRRRDASRLLVLDRANGRTTHDRFHNLPHYLQPQDVLVLNRSKVIPARLRATKTTGGAIEVLLLRQVGSTSWLALLRPGRRLRSGTQLSIDESPVRLTMVERLTEGQWIVEFQSNGSLNDKLRQLGTTPLPPYIYSTDVPAARYQTIYADREGSVAAPTAGFHFSRQLLKRIREEGVQIEYVTLHVGLGTFAPVKTEFVDRHRMLPEWGEVTEKTAARVEEARSRGGRVIAVGTTTTRVLESAASSGKIRPIEGDTDKFIYPGYRFQAIDALITNFHLPSSTLLMLVSAFAGRERVLAAYEEAISTRYRFYSFGDAMLIV